MTYLPPFCSCLLHVDYKANVDFPQMSPKNLAVVFAPTIMRDHSLEKEMTDMHAKNIAVQYLIENSHVIFSDA